MPRLNSGEAFFLGLMLGFTIGLSIGAIIIERNMKAYAEAHR